MPVLSNPARLRICLLTYRGNPHCGGQGVYVRYLSSALREMGHRVDVLSGPPYPVLNPGVRLLRLPSLNLYDPDRLFRTPSFKELCDPINLLEWLDVSAMGFPEPLTFGLRLKKFMRRRAGCYDIVHDNQSLSYGVWAVQKRVPTVVTIHHPMAVDRMLAVRFAPTFLKKVQQLRWYSFIGMQKRVSRRFKQIITVSDRSREDIARMFSIPPGRFRVVPNGIDTNLFRPVSGVRRENDRIVTTCSADTPLKGLGFLMHAVARLQRHRTVRLVVVGAAHTNGMLSGLVGRLGIEKSVTFTGRIGNDQLVSEYAKAAVAVVPSVYEGFGFPAAEAMACGTPVICTAVGAMPEMVGGAGIVVRPGDPQALFIALRDILDDPRRAQRLGQAGLERIHGQFTWQKTAEKTVSVYREAIRDHRIAP